MLGDASGANVPSIPSDETSTSAGIEAAYILPIPAEISTHAQIHVHFFDTKVVVLTQDRGTSRFATGRSNQTYCNRLEI